MYIYCRSCKWEQDDYWSKSYNPLRSLLDWEDALLNQDLDAPCPGGLDNGTHTWRDVIITEIEHRATRVRNMQYRTPEEKRIKNPDDICPSCGKKTLATD